MMEPRRRRVATLLAPRLGDGAVSDMVSTLLLVAMVVAIGGVVATAVTSTLSGPVPAPASFSLVPPQPGDLDLGLRYHNGEPLSLDALSLSVQREGGGFDDVHRLLWSTPNASVLRPGDTLRIGLASGVEPSEMLRVRAVRLDANVLLADLAARTGSTASGFATPTLVAAATPPVLPADGTSAARLTVNVSHPAGGLLVSGVTADTDAIARAAGTASGLLALRDDGQGGDEVGGDGVWSAMLAVPTTTPPADYDLVFRVYDSSGEGAGVVNATLTTQEALLSTAPPSTGEEGATAYSAGTEFSGPTSTNVTQLRLRNWTWDRLHPERVDGDFATIRVLGGGKAWNARIAFQENAGNAYATEILAWHDGAETRYAPDAGSDHLGGGVYGLNLATLDLNLLDPTAESVWKAVQYHDHPLALYPAAGIEEDPRFVLPYFGHDVSTGNEASSIATGVISVQVVFD